MKLSDVGETGNMCSTMASIEAARRWTASPLKKSARDAVFAIAQSDYPANDSRLEAIVRNGSPFRAFGYDAAGNINRDTTAGVTTLYTYNHADRLAAVSRGGTARATYSYNARGQLSMREVVNSANNGATSYIYDQWGHPIAEYDGSTGALKREYVWLNDRPMAVIDPDGAGGDDVYYVHADHLNRPVALTNGTKAVVASFTYKAFGAVFQYTGSVALTSDSPVRWRKRKVVSITTGFDSTIRGQVGTLSLIRSVWLMALIGMRMSKMIRWRVLTQMGCNNSIPTSQHL